jgi:hypothetical protein
VIRESLRDLSTGERSRYATRFLSLRVLISKHHQRSKNALESLVRFTVSEIVSDRDKNFTHESIFGIPKLYSSNLSRKRDELTKKWSSESTTQIKTTTCMKGAIYTGIDQTRASECILSALHNITEDVVLGSCLGPERENVSNKKPVLSTKVSITLEYFPFKLITGYPVLSGKYLE